MSRNAVSEVPEPPPTQCKFAKDKRNTSAITHEPIAKYPPCKRNASTETGHAISVVMTAAIGIATKGFTPASLPKMSMT